MSNVNWLAVAIASTVIVGCGPSGGGSAATDPAPTTPAEPTEPTTPPVVETDVRSAVFISGMAAESLVGTNPVSDAKVSIRVSDTDEDNTPRTRTYSADTDSAGRFTVLVSDVAVEAEGVQAEVTVTKSGMTQGIRTISKFAQEEAQVVLADLVMTPELQATYEIDRESDTELGFATAASTENIRFTVYRGSDGKASILSGDEAASAMAMAGEFPDVDISVPVGNVDESVSSVSAGIRGFTPSDDEQVQNFPGDFIGRGDDSDTNDSVTFNDAPETDDEYRLISTAFAQVRLEDQSGNTLGLDFNEEAATGASSSRPTITLNIAPESFDTITKDRNPDLEGVQVPIYLYRNGWDFAGNGTLVVADGSGGYTERTATDLPPAQTETLFVRLGVDEGNDWVTWINLDWPVRANSADTVEYCLNGNVQYAGTALSGATPYSGYVDLRLPDGSRTNGYVAEGSLSLTGAMLDTNFNADTSAWGLSAMNTLISSRETLDLSEAGTIARNSCTDLGTLELSNPLQCLVNGTLSKEGEGSLANRVVTVAGAGFYKQLKTDSNGQYRSQIPCNLELTVARSLRDDSPAAIVADGTTNSDETSDTPEDVGSIVVADLVVSNAKPVISGVSGPESVRLAADEPGRTVEFAITAFDEDSDSLDIDWTCEPVLASAASVQLTQLESCTVTDAGTYKWTATASDGVSSIEETGFLEVTREEVNTPPSLSFIKRGETALSCEIAESGNLTCTDDVRLTGETVVYTASAIDEDGDSVSYLWQGSGIADTTTADLSIALNSEQALTLTLDDGEDTRTVQLNIMAIANVEPTISPITITSGEPVVGETIVLKATATDDFDSASDLTYVYSLEDDEGVSQSQLITSVFDETENAEIATIAADSLTAFKTYTVFLDVTDSDGGMSSKSYSFIPGLQEYTEGPITIIIE